MMYVASVRDKETKRISIIRSDEYKTKKDFAKEIRCNGYTVRFISTEENFDADCEKYNEACEMNKAVKNELYRTDKKIAESLNMTVAEYRSYVKSC